MSTRAKPQKSTHTHTHTDSFVKSLKQIGTICFTFSFLIFPNFTFATNIPTTNPGCTTTVLGADNVANRSAALEPDFSANTINTTWYSNGTQLTGNGIPSTCTYDEQLLPPTPSDRPGYTFGGWRLKRCEVPSGFDNPGSHRGFKRDSSSSVAYDYVMCQHYQLTEYNTWCVEWPQADKVVIGEAFCSVTDDAKTAGQIGNPGIVGGYAAGGQYCWCRATSYMVLSSAQQCSFASSSWVFNFNCGSATSCATTCALYCANDVWNNYIYRDVVLTGLIAE